MLISLFLLRYMVTEIGARDFADPMRYNMLEVGCRCQHTSWARSRSISLVLNPPGLFPIVSI